MSNEDIKIAVIAVILILACLIWIYIRFWYKSTIQQRKCPYMKDIKCSVKLKCDNCYYFKYKK